MSWVSRRAVLGTTAAVAVVLAAPVTSASAGDSPARTTLQQVPAWVAHATRVGPAVGGQERQMTAVLGLRDEPGAESLARAVSDPGSADYGRYVTAAQWRARFSPTTADVEKVTAWLRSQGMDVGAVPANHRYISFRGTNAEAESAFATMLAELTVNGHAETAPVASVSVPSTLAGTVVGITGLDSSTRAKPMHADERQAGPGLEVGSSAGPSALPPPPPVFRNAPLCSAYYGQKSATDVPQPLEHELTYAPCGYVPAQVRGAYGLDTALAEGYDGRGVTVAVVDAFASPTIAKDVRTYAERNDPDHPLRASQLRQSLAGSYRMIDECGGNTWYGEETLDIEAVHATAPQADILYVGAASCATSDLGAAVNSVVDNELAQVITNSYGSPELSAASEPAALLRDHQTFVQAAAEGISVLFSSGDNGDEIATTGVRQTDMDASDPFVTAVGGTALAVNKDDGYEFEQGWGTGKSTLTKGTWEPWPPAFLYGAGGGTSLLFGQPWYQRGVVPSSIADLPLGPHRAVPDVAMLADPNIGFLVGESQTFPDGSVQYSEYRVGGTSLSSPLFAGTVAVANQYDHARLGLLNPRLYRLAGTPALHDVDHGRAVTDGVVRVDYANRVDSTQGLLTSLRTLNQTGTIYTRPGYDDVTGVGTPNGMEFLKGISK